MAKKIELIKNNLDNGYHYYDEGGQRHDIQTVKHTLDDDVTVYKDGRKYNVHVSKSPLDGSRKIRVDERPGLFDNYRGLFSVNTDDSGSGNSDTSYGNSSASSYSGSTQGTVGPYGGYVPPAVSTYYLPPFRPYAERATNHPQIGLFTILWLVSIVLSGAACLVEAMVPQLILFYVLTASAVLLLPTDSLYDEAAYLPLLTLASFAMGSSILMGFIFNKEFRDASIIISIVFWLAMISAVMYFLMEYVGLEAVGACAVAFAFFLPWALVPALKEKFEWMSVINRYMPYAYGLLGLVSYVTAVIQQTANFGRAYVNEKFSASFHHGLGEIKIHLGGLIIGTILIAGYSRLAAALQNALPVFLWPLLLTALFVLASVFFFRGKQLSSCYSRYMCIPLFLGAACYALANLGAKNPLSIPVFQEITAFLTGPFFAPMRTGMDLATRGICEAVNALLRLAQLQTLSRHEPFILAICFTCIFAVQLVKQGQIRQERRRKS